MDDTFANRAKSSMMELMKKERDPNLGPTELGRRIGRKLRTDPIAQQTVSKWINLGTIPDTTTEAALAAVLGVDPGWLHFGDASEAPQPSFWRQERERGKKR